RRRPDDARPPRHPAAGCDDRAQPPLADRTAGVMGGGSRGTLSFGPYRVLEELGSGALSTVYKAVQEPLGRVVAVKALKETIAPSSPFAAQLEREARVLGQLSHPSVVLLFDFVKTESQMYLVLEHIDGWSLATLLGKRARFSPEFTAAIGV